MIRQPSLDNPCSGRLFAGARPRGPIHLGELCGAVETWVHLQDHYECIFIIADASLQDDRQHSQPVDKMDIYEMLADWLAVGISPNHSIIALESSIPERLKLAELFRIQIGNNNWSVEGFDSQSPGSMEAAEILLFKADAVALTADQSKSSLNTARTLAIALNQQVGDVFPVPKTHLIPGSHLPGLDGRPMQRPYQNTILLKEYDEETEQKLETATIDTLIMYATRFNQDSKGANALVEGFTAGNVGEKELREYAATSVNTYLHSARVKRDKWIANPEELETILQVGARRAMAIAFGTITEISERLRWHKS